MALIERGKADGQIAGDDVRRAFEADQIPPTQWKNVLRSLNQILEEEGVTLMVSAAESPKRARKSVAAKSPVKRTATKTVAAKTTVTRTVAATAAPAAESADAGADDAVAAAPAKKAAAKKTAAKKTAVKKTAAKKTAAKKSGKQDDELLDGDEPVEEVDGKGEEEEGEGENKGFVLSDDDEDDAPAQQVAIARRHRRPGQGLPEADRQGSPPQRRAGGRARQRRSASSPGRLRPRTAPGASRRPATTGSTTRTGGSPGGGAARGPVLDRPLARRDARCQCWSSSAAAVCTAVSRSVSSCISAAIFLSSGSNLRPWWAQKSSSPPLIRTTRKCLGAATVTAVCCGQRARGGQNGRHVASSLARRAVVPGSTSNQAENVPARGFSSKLLLGVAVCCRLAANVPYAERYGFALLVSGVGPAGRLAGL
ncbi:hypothetical protein SBADM41S_07504 [Streptomyces badius]